MSKKKRNSNLKRRSKKKDIKVSNIESAELSGNSLETNGENNELIERLLCDAESEIDAFNYVSAADSCNKVLGMNSENTKALEMLAGIQLENGNMDEAKNLLLRCIDLCPDDGYSKYFSMGQLCSGKNALECFEKGVSILEKGIKNYEPTLLAEDNQDASLRRALSDAYCSIVELYMTDFCFEEDAEVMCKKAIENAIQADPSNFEAHQCHANYQIVKEDLEEARSAMKQSLALWLPQYQALLESEASSDILNSYQPPSYDSRINASKVLIELEMFYEASEVLEGLITEDDEVVEVWYLLGWLNFSQGDEYKRNAVYYLKKAREVFAKVGIADEDQMAHISELLKEMGDKYDYEEDEASENFPSDSDSDNNDMET